MGRVAALVEKRGALIASVDEIDGKMAEERARLALLKETPARAGNHPPVLSPGGAIGSLLEEAARWDRKCLERSEKVRDETRAEMATLRQGLRAALQYTYPGGRETAPRFKDVNH